MNAWTIRKTCLLSLPHALKCVKEWICSRNFSASHENNAKYVQFAYPNCPCDNRVGVIDGGRILDLNVKEKGMACSMVDFLQKGLNHRDVRGIKRAVAFEEIIHKAPITGMDKVLCVGTNYMDFCEKHKVTVPCEPIIFSKFASSIIGPSECLRLRTGLAQKVDFEVELCIVIGKIACCVPVEEAMSYIFGCTIAQDISDRFWQREKNGGQFLLGKSMDTFCPLGPWIVTVDELGNLENLQISCSVNNQYVQQSKTDKLIFSLAFIISWISTFMTLLPGDIILTGTPAGVGMYRNPQVFLKPGDEISSEIEKIGCLKTKVTSF